MKSAVAVSAITMRALWVVNIGLGVYIAYFATSASKLWTLTHVFTGVLVVAVVWFLGIAQALVKGGTLALTGATFLAGLGVTLVGMTQVAVPAGAGLITVQLLHVAFVLAAIASGEICVRRYRTGLASQGG